MENCVVHCDLVIGQLQVELNGELVVGVGVVVALGEGVAVVGDVAEVNSDGVVLKRDKGAHVTRYMLHVTRYTLILIVPASWS